MNNSHLPQSAWEAANMAGFMVRCGKCGADKYEPCTITQGAREGLTKRATHKSRRSAGYKASRAWAIHIQRWR